MLTTTTADLYDPAQLDPADLALDDWFAQLPVIQYDHLPPAPPQIEQDDVDEGLGGPGDSPVPPGQALKACAQAIKDGTAVDVGQCLHYSRLWYGVGPLAVSANESFEAIPPQFRHRITDLSMVPRGPLVYLHGHQYGHIAPTFGQGWLGSTDWPTGKVGRVRVDVLAAAWGYDMAAVYWSPIVNDVRVWRPSKPTPPPAPEPVRGPRVDAMIASTLHDRLTAIRARKYARENELPRRARDLDAVVQRYSAVIDELRDVQPLNA